MGRVEWARKYYLTHREQVLDYNRGWYQKNKEKRKQYAHEWYLKNREKVREYGANYYKANQDKRREYWAVNRERFKINRNLRYPERKKELGHFWREQRREHRREIKKEVLTYYGNGNLACVRCGFADIRALSIDHIDGKGIQDRKARGSHSTAGVAFYQCLKRQGYPDGYQTLCMNCQFIKRDEKREYGNLLLGDIVSLKQDAQLPS